MTAKSEMWWTDRPWPEISVYTLEKSFCWLDMAPSILCQPTTHWGILLHQLWTLHIPWLEDAGVKDQPIQYGYHVPELLYPWEYDSHSDDGDDDDDDDDKEANAMNNEEETKALDHEPPPLAANESWTTSG